MLIDQHERTLAVNPKNSCLVRAPAGSGKTTLMINRIHNLLADHIPAHQITVLTFTRAATQEIKKRVLGTDTHPSLTEEKTKELKIKTYDEWVLNTLRSLNHEAAFPIHPNPEELYAKACQRLFNQQLHDPESALCKILTKDWGVFPRLQQSCQRLLQKRDQWLPYIMMGDPEWLEHQWDHTRLSICTHLAQLLRTQQKKFTDILIYCQETCPELIDINPREPFNLTQCHILAKWLFTKTGQIRHPSSKMGFEPKASAKCPITASKYKADYLAIKDFINEQPDILVYLRLMANYQECDSQPFTSLVSELLPQLIAHLKVVFQEEQKSDFIENSLNLLDTLQQADETPETLRHTQHLLLDEFQDTSSLQYELLGYITKEWSADEQSSVFIVGDPMQSIYGFRNADVRLMIELETTKAFHHLPIHSLSLRANFRSGADLINHCNDLFSQLLPQKADSNLCHLPYQPSLAQTLTSSHIQTFKTESSQKNSLIIELVKKSAEQSVGILVATRSQGAVIRRALQNANIIFDDQAICSPLDDALSHDLTCLFAAMHRPDCDMAWGALSQTSWAQIPWQTLYDIEPSGEKSLSAHLFDRIESLPDSAIGLLNNIKRSWQIPGCRWQQFIDTVNQIHPEIVTLDYLDPLFAFLESTKPTEAYLPDLMQRLERQAGYPAEVDCKITLTTIHQAKGLEYDHVILPYLNQSSPPSARDLLSWDTWRSSQDQKPIPLLASMADSSFHLEWIDYLTKHKNMEEKKRVLYVALTRAKTTLSLIYDEQTKQNSFQQWLNMYQSAKQSFKDNLTIS